MCLCIEREININVCFFTSCFEIVLFLPQSLWILRQRINLCVSVLVCIPFGSNYWDIRCLRAWLSHESTAMWQFRRVECKFSITLAFYGLKISAHFPQPPLLPCIAAVMLMSSDSSPIPGVPPVCPIPPPSHAHCCNHARLLWILHLTLLKCLCLYTCTYVYLCIGSPLSLY